MKQMEFVLVIILFLTGFKLHSQNLVSFSTTNTTLQEVFDKAETKAKGNISKFGKYQVLIEGAQYTNVWLETQPLGGCMYAKRDLTIAKNNIQIFMDLQREDGRFPGMISCKDNTLVPYYGWFQGYCFPMPAFEIYFLLNKDKKYLNELYNSLVKFDEYLWKTHDSDNNGCLETWCVYDTGEDNCTRFGESPNAWPFDYPPSQKIIMKMTENEQKETCHKSKYNFSKDIPVPIESMDVMSYSYTGRDVLSLISKELKNGRETYWRVKANEVRRKIKDYLWISDKHACYDKDKDNKVMDILIHNNIRCMYFGSFDQQMADEFINYHLLNPKEFWTPMPLPSIAANDPFFRNISGNNWSGQPQGLTYQRSIRALENYGHYAELTLIGKKFLKVVEDSTKFVQQFDPFKAVISSPGQDGYGPCILTTLEFISRLYGIHMSQDRVYWSCLNSTNDYKYVQVWGDWVFKMETQGDQVVCLINGKEVFSFTKGIRVVSDLSGKILEAVGIDENKQKTSVNYKGKTFPLSVEPNSVYFFDGKFSLANRVGFKKPL